MEKPENINFIQKAKGMLPNIPNEVFDIWLLPIILHHNTWPYLDVFSPHPSDQWGNYFRGFTIYDFANCLWNRIPLTFAMDCLDPVSNNTIETLIRDHVYGFETPAREVQDSKSRFFGFVELIKRTGTIPAPIIGINTPVGFGVLDGHHRISALTHMRLRGKIKCDTWVAHS